MTSLLLAIDSGSTATKVAVFDAEGTVVTRGSVSTPRVEAAPGHVERDPEEHWRVVALAVQETMATARIDPRRIAAIGLAAQGDGLHLIGEDGAVVRPAILSSDSRASRVVERWADDGTLDDLRRLTGQIPFPGSPAPLLRALREDEPAVLTSTRWILSSKDWLRFRMTGRIATDRTDAAASFADLATQKYSTGALAATGLEDVAGMLPEILEPGDVAGALTASAAEQLGLMAGTPVATGLHDVSAAITGTVGLAPGRLCMIVGTFGVNVALSAHPRPSPTVNIRSGPVPDLWSVRRTSRAAMSNVEWAARVLSPAADRDAQTRAAVSRALLREPRRDPPVYVPFLFGGNAGQPDAAAFLGLRNWHGPDELLRGVVEGVTFNHRHDVELLEDELDISDVLLVGGASRSVAWRQLFADTLGRPVTITPEGDTGTRGAAMCAAVAGGVSTDLAEAAQRLAPDTEIVEPRRTSGALESRYRAFREATIRTTAFDAARTRGAALSEGL